MDRLSIRLESAYSSSSKPSIYFFVLFILFSLFASKKSKISTRISCLGNAANPLYLFILSPLLFVLLYVNFLILKLALFVYICTFLLFANITLTVSHSKVHNSDKLRQILTQYDNDIPYYRIVDATVLLFRMSQYILSPRYPTARSDERW